MKSLILIFVIGISQIVSFAQQKSDVVIGSIDTVYSQVLKEPRVIWVHVPASFRNNPKKRYPVIYLLDGDRTFSGVVGMIHLLSGVNGNTDLPEMIVVGILNTDRYRDLTPTQVMSGLWVDSTRGRGSGGGEAFLTFIEKELIPHVDSSYPAGRYRMLIGHSLGGLMAIHTLIHHKKLFNSYVAIEPSMWWDQQKLLHESGLALKTDSFAGSALFLGMANTLPPGMDTTTMQIDTTEGTIHARSILQLSRFVLAKNQNGLEAAFKYYPGESHGSVPLIATYDAVHFIFKDYQLNLELIDVNDPTFPMAAYLKNHYETISTKYGITDEEGRTLLPPEDLVNNRGFYAMSKKEYNKATDLFLMNIKNYPAGFRAYDYLGDLYLAEGDKIKAIDSYKKSLSLKENIETRKKLDQLRGK